MSYQQSPISFIPGINPEPDETKQNTRYIIDGNNVRFFRGGAQKFGGHVADSMSEVFSGVARSVFSFERSNKKWQIIGTNTRLYAKLGGTVTNITPLQTSSTAIANSLATYYTTLANNPLNTATGLTTVIVAQTAHKYEIGDTVTISGVPGDVGGIPQAQLNAAHVVQLVPNANSFTILVATAASSAVAGGGASVISASGILTVTAVAHGLSNGDRIKLSGAATTGGVTDTLINVEHVIRDKTTDTFDVVTTGTSTSSVSAGGGASTVYFKQITAGGEEAETASGPWVGVPWSGLPWSVQTDTSLVVQPRIWWMDAWGDNLVCGPGGGGKCYEWLGDTATAPTIIANAPDADWGWVEDVKLVILSGNTIANSDVGDYTDWTPGSGSDAYSDAKEDANKLIGRVFANGENLIFADENKLFRLRWVGGTAKWVWQLVSNTIGVVSPHGGIAVGGLIYLFGKDNLYVYNGGIVQPLPNNTLLKYLFEDVTLYQRFKFFVWYNQRYNEVNFHYQSGDGDDCDRSVVYSITEGHFTKRESLNRTAADTSGQVYDYPILVSSTGQMYQHETGVDDDESALNSFYQVSYEAVGNGKFMTDISGMEPDLILTGNMTVELYGKERSRTQAETLLESFTLTEADTKIDCEHTTRWRSWLWRSNEVGGNYRSGRYSEFVEQGGEF